MKRRGQILIALTLLALAPCVRAQNSGDILDQKRELDKIQKDVEAGQRRLDSLQAEERRVQQEVGQYDDRISSDRQVIRRLTGELGQLQNSIAHGDSTLNEYRTLLERRRRRYLGSIRQLYAITQPNRPVLTDSPTRELDHVRQIIYLTALADLEASNIDDASDLVNKSLDDLNDMSGRRKMITGLKRERETSYALGRSQKERREKNLDQLKRKSMAEADRVIMLRQAAEEMQTILARLEEERVRTTESGSRPSGPSAFAALEGQLLSPFRGEITEAFGQHVDPVTKLKSFSPGITITGRAHRQVYSVASGSVAYSGNLRGYGNFVIINHDHQYYSTYAGLGEVLVSVGQFLQTRTKLGTSGQDGVVKFELRKGHEPLDPVKWIKIESL